VASVEADFPYVPALIKSSKFQAPIPKKLRASTFKKACHAAVFLEFGCWRFVLTEKICYCDHATYLSRLMPKPIARSKTRKSVAKRFKITARGKVLRAHSSRRHLLSSKNAKRKRRLSKAARVHHTDVARIKANLPFG
jgi:large subunit ribosomal protein L35